MKPEQKVWNVKEVAVVLGVHTSTIYRMLGRGEITGFKIGSDWRFNISDIEKWRLEHASATITRQTNPSRKRSTKG